MRLNVLSMNNLESSVNTLAISSRKKDCRTSFVVRYVSEFPIFASAAFMSFGMSLKRFPPSIHAMPRMNLKFLLFIERLKFQSSSV